MKTDKGSFLFPLLLLLLLFRRSRADVALQTLFSDRLSTRLHVPLLRRLELTQKQGDVLALPLRTHRHETGQAG